MEEIWKDIEGYENLYQVSDMGRVKSLKFGKERILKSIKTKNGYLQVDLSKKGKTKKYLIHRLVAQAFLPNPNNLPQVNHRSEDKTDNRVENIEYCNSRYNSNYGSRNERVAKSKFIPILQFTKEGKFVKKWNSAIQVSKELGIKRNNICNCLKGRSKTAGDYVWMYAVINGVEIDISKLKKVA